MTSEINCNKIDKSLNEQKIDDIVREYDRDLIAKTWAPRALVYNVLKIGSIDSTDTVPHDRAIARAQYVDYKPNKKVKGNPECTVFVGRLSPSTNTASLKRAMSAYGPIVRARVVTDIVTGFSKRYGFVEYATEAAAQNAYAVAHMSSIDNSPVIVDMEAERLLPGWVPRRLGGGFCGKKESGQLRFGCRIKPFKKPITLLKNFEVPLIDKPKRIMSRFD